MAITFGTIGNIQESVFEHLRSNLVASGIGSNHVSGTFIRGYLSEEQLKNVRYPHEFINGTANVTDHVGMPIISYAPGPLDTSSFEMGSTDQLLSQRILISIFALDEIDMVNLVNQILYNISQKSIDFLDYDANPEGALSIGTLFVNPNIRIFPVRSSGELSSDSISRHRTDIVFTVSNK